MKVLLATDGSDYSELAAEFLRRFDFTAHDEITILHVISQIPYEDDYHAQIRQAIKRVAPKVLKSAADILSPLKARISTAEEQGYPDTGIISTAVDSDTDLIVMGASGIKGIQRVFIGSTTRSVAINSPRSVLVVKPPKEKAPGPMKVIFATDGSDPAEVTGRLLSSLPFPEDTEITVLNVAWSSFTDIPETLVMEINDRMKAEAARARAMTMKTADEVVEHARTFLRGRFSTIQVQTKFGDPSVELLNAERSMGVDVIALGCRGLRGLKGMMGSVSRRILGHSACSVLIGKGCA